MFDPPLSRKQVDKELSKLQKINYNQFRWWRMYQPKNKLLHHRKPLDERILNGDFDYSCYKVQSYWCEYQLNDILESCNGDHENYIEKSKLMMARRKRLLEDFEKDEKERLESIVKEFRNRFICSKEQVEEEMSNYNGSLIDFYHYMKEKYSISIKSVINKKRGRPKKTK